MNLQDSEKTIARLTNTIDVYKQLLKEKNQIIGAAKKISPDTIEKAKAIVKAKAMVETRTTTTSKEVQLPPMPCMDASITCSDPSSFKVNFQLDHIYVINLDKDIHKMQTFKEQVGNRFTYTRIKGVEVMEGTRKLKKGQLGCLRSHQLIIEHAIKHNYRNILIFEDDVIFKDSWENIKTTINYLQHLEPNLLYLGCSQHYKWTEIKIINNYYHTIQSYGSFAVMINESIFTELLNKYKQETKPIDHYLIEYQTKNKPKCVVMYPNKVIADVTTSNTGCKPRDQNKFAKRFKWY